MTAGGQLISNAYKIKRKVSNSKGESIFQKGADIRHTFKNDIKKNIRKMAGSKWA